MATKEELGQLLKIDQKRQEIQKLQAEMNDPSFWQDPKKSQGKIQELSGLERIVHEYDQAETPDQLHNLEIKALLNERYDENNALISIHAGAGGTEAQDWTQMLLRMFERFSQRRGFQDEILEISSGEEAGVKSVTLKVTGPYAFGLLKSEAGVHRLVRISPYDADKSRHTSFALVEVIPEIKNEKDLKIDEKDLRIDVYRSSGHGGQSVNTTDSAVRITHLPTQIVVSCQNERSQLQNKSIALKILQSRLLTLKLKEQKEQEAKLRGEHLSVGWGNQIRSYVLQPYRQVKDHRTEAMSTNPNEVLGGNLDLFIESYLKKSQISNLKSQNDNSKFKKN